MKLVWIFEYSSSLYTLTHSRVNVRKVDTNKCPKRYLWLRILLLNIDWTEKGPLSNYLLRKNLDQYCCSFVWKAPLMVSNCNQMQNILKRSSLQMHLHFGHSFSKIGPQSPQSASESMCAQIAHTDINIYCIHIYTICDRLQI